MNMKARWVFFILVALLLAVTLVVIGRTNNTTNIQRPADREAAGFADGYLLQQINAAADASVNDRPSAVEDWLHSIAGNAISGTYESIMVGHGEGAEFPVAIYTLWDNRSFSGAFDGSPFYGRVCRVYSVTDDAVASKPVECPASVPDQPTASSLSDEGWFEE